MYLFLSSRDSTDIYPLNKPEDFTVKLPSYLNFQGTWHVGLMDIQLPTILNIDNLEYLNIYCDLPTENITEESRQPILRRIPIDENYLMFNPIIYIKLSLQEFDRIRIYIKGNKGEPVSFKQKTLSCTLHLKRLY